jgi:D-alanine-D-alanine ligase
LGSDVIVEEYIHGRELYVGVLETADGPRAFSPRELFFAKIAKSDPMVATYRAKWDDAYREKWGISTGKAATLPEHARQKLMYDSVSLFKILGLSGYARLDWRLSADGEPVFLEANPNPALSQEDDFAKAAKTHGYSYGELIATIAQSAVAQMNQRDPRIGTQLNPRCSATTRPIISKERSSA